MARHADRPLVFPLSNPTSRSEASPADLLAWTGGRALVAAGSPFGRVTYEGCTVPVSQCNNSYVFPGLGLGVITSGARRVTDALFLAAARVLSDCVPTVDRPDAALLPSLEELPAVSRLIALAVGAEAQRQGLAPQALPEGWERAMEARRWEPSYLPLRPDKTGGAGAR
jgi:malate dehydrogenase (oxaloacetate-decarboxylating)